MVLNHIFHKSSSPDKDKKDKDKDKDKKKERKEKDKDRERPRSIDQLPQRSPSRSTTVAAPESPALSPHSPGSPLRASRKSPTKSSSVSYRDLHHSRSSSAASRHSFFSSSRHSHSLSRDSHPLNLPPDELRRHLSAMAAAREEMRSSMDIDRDVPTSPAVAATSPAQHDATMANGVYNNAQLERSPTPPPHRTSPSQSQPSDGGEAFKLAGNKFYKAGDYDRAIQEYNKGRSKE